MSLSPGRNSRSSSAFTLVELVVVLVIIGLAFGIIIPKTGPFAYWRQEGFLREISDTLTFLHQQAVADQAFYRMEFDLEANSFVVGAIRPESDLNSGGIQGIAEDAGNLTLELAAYLNPSLGTTYTVIPPPSFPSLGEEKKLPDGITIQDIRTRQGKFDVSEAKKVALLFSPRGFSEFAVIHLKLNNNQSATILMNPFTGATDLYREYKDFEWTYDAKKKKES